MELNLESITPAAAREIVENCGDLEIVIWQNERSPLLFTFGIYREYGEDGKPLLVLEPFAKDEEEVLEILEFTLNGIRIFYGCEDEEGLLTSQLVEEILSECRGKNIVSTRRLLRKIA
jgi:hypothetical protein